MNKSFQSIEDLLDDNTQNSDASDIEESTQIKFKNKQEQINRKEIEKRVSETAQKIGIPYISLVGFPISPEALSKISEDTSKRLNVVCFFYDGEQFRIAATDITEDIKNLFEDLEKSLHCHGEIYLISEVSFAATFKLYKNLPKLKEIIRGVKITEEELNKYS
ncbi:hypothetical protein COT95_02040, partial [Candidatus Falkowbacteria bacterium CG10_big_fil_rev_8_21_14_0_10_37_6]